jgi:DNA-directed RNA polymerase specialized sigma24 family protein
MGERSEAKARPDAGTSSLRFPATQWSVVLRSQDKGDLAEANKALATLCETYWYPLYAFACSKGKSHHDAQDLTQGFFAYVVEKDIFGDADRSKGKLRTFLLTVFSRYISRDYQAGGRGGRIHVSLDENAAGAARKPENQPSVEPDADRIFDQAWAHSTLTAAKRDLQAEEEAAGKGEVFQVLQPFLEADSVRGLSYEAVAVRLGLNQAAARQAVSRLRKRYHHLIRARIAITLPEPTEEAIDEEMRFLREAFDW